MTLPTERASSSIFCLFAGEEVKPEEEEEVLLRRDGISFIFLKYETIIFDTKATIVVIWVPRIPSGNYPTDENDDVITTSNVHFASTSIQYAVILWQVILA